MIQRDISFHQTVKNMRMYFNTLAYRTPHFHKDIEIIWALENSLEIQIGSELRKVHEGEMILLNSEQPHEIKATGKSCTVLGIQISPELVKNEVPEFGQIYFDEYSVNSIPQPVYHDMEEILFNVMWQYLTQPDYYELYCKSQMQFFICMLLTYIPHRVLTEEQSQIQEQQNARLQRLIQFVDQNYMNNIRLSEFAESEGRSLSHISHFIQNTMHQSFREYVALVRYNAACKMMAAGQYKMLDICMACGFSDYKYFSKVFVSRTGLTPEAYGRKILERTGDETSYKHSIHSRERFYTPEQSLRLVERFRAVYVS